ncbi:hypothetical protein FRC04_002344 [Tulasnella sp. 424]|nr:hypothetical protein FRC04_002344 [Tulasnella sp. 424]KAG8977418.1 hypothetical protein FRC05_001816 [Tulasnella sp. 425]
MIAPLRVLSFFFLFFFVALIQAREASLYSSSVSYCSPPDAILIQQFDARYFKDNSSLVFDIVASTVLPGLNVTAKVNLNAYGMEPVDLSFNLCEVSKALCPLPQYNFTGASTVPIPAIQEKIPDIAYFMPDLEAAATLQLVQIETNKTVACVQITLSNGWSTRQRPVGWLVGGLFIFAFAISAIFTFTDVFFRSSLPNIPYPLIPSSLAAFAPHPRTFISTTPLLYRFLTLWFFLQHIVLTSILDLNYPLLYRSFALNFSWSFGLFASNPRSHLQRSIFSLRSRTGSNNTDEAMAPLQYTDRNLSPYNGKGGNGLGRRDFYTPPTVNEENGNALSGGITLYSNSLGIAEGNAFLSLFYVLLFIVAVAAVAVGLGYALVRLVEWVWLPRQKKDKYNWTVERRYLDGVKAIGARVALGLTVPTFVLALFQWTIGDSWLAVLLSVLTIVTLASCLVYSAYLLVKVYRHHAWSKTTEPLPYPLSPYTEPWATHRWFTTIAFTVPIMILKSALTSFAKSSGFVQVIAFIIMDGVALAAIFVFKPGKTRSSDVLEGFIAFIRLVTSCCLVAFVETVKVKPIPRVAVGIVLLVLESVVIIVLFLGVIRNVIILVVAGVKRRLDGRGGVIEDDDHSSERRVRAMTMATTTSTDVTSAHKSPGAHGGYAYGGYGFGDSRSGATTPTDSRSILPPFAKEVASNNNINVHNQGFSTSTFDIEKPETIYPKSYAPSSSVATGLGLSFAGTESKLSFDAFGAPIHAKYSTAGVAVPRASSDFNHSDSTHVGSATGVMLPGGHGHHDYHRYPSVVLEGDEKDRGDSGSISASTIVSDIRPGFVRGEL